VAPPALDFMLKLLVMPEKTKYDFFDFWLFSSSYGSIRQGRRETSHLSSARTTCFVRRFAAYPRGHCPLESL
jgi:hypothetical protein